MVLVYGFGGMRDFSGRLSFNPRLPESVEQLRFPSPSGGQILEDKIGEEAATYMLRKGTELTITHQDEEIKLSR